MTFTNPGFEIHLNENMTNALREQRRTGGVENFERTLNRVLAVPRNERDRPSDRFVAAANELRGWLF